MNEDLRLIGATLVLLGRAGISLSPHPTDPNLIRWYPAEAPRGLIRRLLNVKPAVLALLTRPLRFSNEATRYVCEERMGVAQLLELECHTGSPPWLVAVGEAIESDPMIDAVDQDQIPGLDSKEHADEDVED